jgi:hypothetical protein
MTPMRRHPSPSLLDLESLWQQITYRFESQGRRVPLPWRAIRRAVAKLFLVGARGIF